MQANMMILKLGFNGPVKVRRKKFNTSGLRKFCSLAWTNCVKQSGRLGTVLKAHVRNFPTGSWTSNPKTSQCHTFKPLLTSAHEVTADNTRWLISGRHKFAFALEILNILTFHDIVQHSQRSISTSLAKTDPFILQSASSDSNSSFKGRPDFATVAAYTLSSVLSDIVADILPQHLLYPLTNSTQLTPPSSGTKNRSAIDEPRLSNNKGKELGISGASETRFS